LEKKKKLKKRQNKMAQIQAHVAEYKKDKVKELVGLIAKYPIIGIVNMENLPAPQLQTMRAQLRKDYLLTMTKRRLIEHAFKEAKSKKKGIEELEKELVGMPALIFTKENPFKLSKTLQKSKSPAPAKAGQTAPRDIIVNRGPTPFAPGPIIGELAVAGIKSGVEGGKVAVKEDAVVAKAGEKIKPKVAEILTRLGIQPMEVGLDLVAVLENGLIYKRDILAIDESEYLERLSNASRWAFNLANFAHYPTKETLPVLIGKAHNDAKAIGIERNIFDKEIIDILLGKAEQQMIGLKSEAKISDAPPKEALKVEETAKKKEEPIAKHPVEKKQAKKEDPDKVPTLQELEQAKKEREKEEEMKNVEKIAKDIQKKAVKNQK
jgi:large subunit ribosomal protein L10